MTEINYEEINPGVRKLVKFLNDLGFKTCDSGDGVTRDYECDPGYPYVVIECEADTIINRSKYLAKILKKIGVKLEELDEYGECGTIEVLYNPLWTWCEGKIGLINLINVTDSMIHWSKVDYN